MFISNVQDIYYAVLPTTIAILLAIYYMKKKNFAKPTPLSEDIKQERLSSFAPEPLISNVLQNLKRNDEIVPDDVLNLAKMNYFNFLNDPELKKEAEECIRSYGVGSCGPRGFYGTQEIHLNLEMRLAEFMQMEEAVLYSYGFSTTASAIAAYCKPSDFLFCDENVSFACLQGIKAAKSKTIKFKHNDVVDLEAKLKEVEEKEKIKKTLFRKFLIVEGIYSSTGDICPLPQLMELRRRYKLRIFIDETISFGLLGKSGRGVTEHYNIDRQDVDMIIGSLEGATASVGGFCVGASVVIEHQRLSGLGYCFSASLPPFLSHVAISILDKFDQDNDMFKKLERLSVEIDSKLKQLHGYSVLSDAISPLKVVTLIEEENRKENLKKIQTHFVKNKVYVTCEEEYIQFNISVTFDEETTDKIINLFESAYETI